MSKKLSTAGATTSTAGVLLLSRAEAMVLANAIQFETMTASGMPEDIATLICQVSDTLGELANSATADGKNYDVDIKVAGQNNDDFARTMSEWQARDSQPAGDTADDNDDNDDGGMEELEDELNRAMAG